MLRRSAFSLVELSIVLVILGLLVGGVLAGQSLIRASEIRSLATDIAKIQTATHSFRNRYFALPGDITNATSFWGAAAGGHATPSPSACQTANIAITNTGTCNGDGNGEIHYTTESRWFFEHLSLAGLIEGNYAGANQSTIHGRMLVKGVNTYATRLPHVAIQPYNTSTYEQVGNVLGIASDQFDNTLIMSPAIRAVEAWNLDTKMDDGHASLGRFMAANGYNTSALPYPGWCTTNSGSRFDNTPAGAAQYTNLNNTLGTGCIMRYRF